MVLAMAICETCPPAEVDIMISVLLNLFDTRTSLVNLLKLMIDREISHTGIHCFLALLHRSLTLIQRASLLFSEEIRPTPGSSLRLRRFTDTTI
jgi:hypothetical protein